VTRLRRFATLCVLPGILLTGCTSADGDLILGDGYRGPDDPCRGIGAFFTNAPDDASPDLVGCPVNANATLSGRVIVPLGVQSGFDTFYLVPEAP
jgi:hypothetical protein